MHHIRENLIDTIKLWEQHETMATLASCCFGYICSLSGILCPAMGNTVSKNVHVRYLLRRRMNVNFMIREIFTVLAQFTVLRKVTPVF